MSEYVSKYSTGQDIDNALDKATTAVQPEDLDELKEDLNELQGALNYVTPEMFGAVGDGITDDTQALNDMFASAYDNKMSVLGALGKVYSINGNIPTQETVDTQAQHFGVLCKGGTSIRDLHIKVSNGSRQFTVPLTCNLDGNDYIIENCTFESYEAEITIGTEDGGLHGILFTKNSCNMATDWQSDCGNITIRNCNFKKIPSYGIFMIPIDGKLIVDNCNFECGNVGILPYATISYITNCYYDHFANYRGVISLCQDEIERFTGNIEKHKSIYISDCYSLYRLYNIDYHHMTGLSFDEIIIKNCKARKIIHTYNRGERGIKVGKYLIEDFTFINDTVGAYEEFMLIQDIESDITIRNVEFPATINRVEYKIYSSSGSIKFENVKFNNPMLIGEENTSPLNLIFNNCVINNNSEFPFLQVADNCIVDDVYMNDCLVNTTKRIFLNSNIKNIFINNLTATTFSELCWNANPLTTNITINGIKFNTPQAAYTYLIGNVTGEVSITTSHKYEEIGFYNVTNLKFNGANSVESGVLDYKPSTNDYETVKTVSLKANGVYIVSLQGFYSNNKVVGARIYSESGQTGSPEVLSGGDGHSHAEYMVRTGTSYINLQLQVKWGGTATNKFSYVIQKIV